MMAKLIHTYLEQYKFTIADIPTLYMYAGLCTHCYTVYNESRYKT